jgi:tetratricopeptide (TPR) repeat protein
MRRAVIRRNDVRGPSVILPGVRRASLLALVLSLGTVPTGLVGCGGATTAATTVVTAAPVVLDPEAVREYQAGLDELERPSRAAERRARAHFEAALTADPNIWEARYCLGVLQRRAGELQDAAASFEAARALAPTSEEVLIALAEARYELGERDAAAQLLQGYVASAPDDVAARVSLATILRERGDYDGALTQAREVLIRQPSSARALAEVGRVYRAREQYDVAELVLQKALDLGETAELHNDMGLLELARGDTQAAFEQFDRAIALDASYAPAHLNQGSVLLHAGDYAGAEAHYRAVLEAHEDDLDARVALAISLRGRGEHADAQREYERVLDASPSHAAALYDLGVLLAEFRDQRPRARELFQRYLEVAPGSAPQRETAQHYVQDIGAEMAPSAPPPSDPFQGES